MNFFGHWPITTPPKPKNPPCEWRYVSFTEVETCEQDGAKQLDGHWYCDAHYEPVKAGKEAG